MQQKYATQVGSVPEAQHLLNMSAERLRVLQTADKTLNSVRRAASGESSTAGIVFFRRDELLYQQWVARERDGEGMATEQLMLSMDCCPTVNSLAYNTPLAGHLG